MRFLARNLNVLKVLLLCTALMTAGLAAVDVLAEESWSVRSSSAWKEETASADAVTVEDGRLFLDGARQGQWTSRWHDWRSTIQSAQIVVEAEIDLFANKTVEVVVDGSKKPYTDADGVPHDWYGRCMIAIIDENRWIMALRSGINHIDIGKRDTIHLITSSDEGRTWSELNRWFDGTAITGMLTKMGIHTASRGSSECPTGILSCSSGEPGPKPERSNCDLLITERHGRRILTGSVSWV